MREAGRKKTHGPSGEDDKFGRGSMGAERGGEQQKGLGPVPKTKRSLSLYFQGGGANFKREQTKLQTSVVLPRLQSSNSLLGGERIRRWIRIKNF